MNIRKRFFAMVAALFAAKLAWGGFSYETIQKVSAQSQRLLTKFDFERLMTELSNWGRWGKEDQMGAMNLITPMKRKQAAALVKEGVSVSLSRDTDKEKEVDNPLPFVHVMNSIGTNSPEPYCLDTYTISYHGFAHT